MSRHFIQPKLWAPTAVVAYVEALNENMCRKIINMTDHLGYKYSSKLLSQLYVQGRQFLNHMVNCVFYEQNEIHYGVVPEVPFPVASDLIRKKFNLLFHTSKTNIHQLKANRKGFVSAKKAMAFDAIFDITPGNSLTNECSLFRFNIDVFNDLCTLFIEAKPADFMSYEQTLAERIATSKLNKPYIDTTAIHNRNKKNPVAQLYKQRAESQETIIFDFQSGFRELKRLIKQRPEQKLYYISVFRKFFAECLETGKVLSGTNIKNVRIETYLNYYVDPHGRMYDTLNFIGLPGSLKNALTPDYINYDMRACYISIMKHYIKSSYYTLDDPRVYLYNKLKNKGLMPYRYKEAKSVLKELNLREQFCSLQLNEHSEVVSSLKDLDLDYFAILDVVNNDTHIKDLRIKTTKYWDKLIKTNYMSPRRLPFYISGNRNVCRKLVATAFLQGLEANLIDVYVLNLTKTTMDTIINLNNNETLNMTFKGRPWSSIEHDGFRVHKKHTSIPKVLSYGSLSIQLEISNNTNNTPVGSQPTNTISNTTNSTTNSQSLPPLNELQKGNDFQGTGSVGVSVNTAVCSGSQKVEKHKVTKKSDWRFLTDFSTKNGKQHGTLN